MNKTEQILCNVAWRWCIDNTRSYSPNHSSNSFETHQQGRSTSSESTRLGTSEAQPSFQDQWDVPSFFLSLFCRKKVSRQKCSQTGTQSTWRLIPFHGQFVLLIYPLGFRSLTERHTHTLTKGLFIFPYGWHVWNLWNLFFAPVFIFVEKHWGKKHRMRHWADRGGGRYDEP